MVIIMNLDITDIPIEKIEDIVQEYRTIKLQNADNYNDKSANEFLEDKIVNYTNIKRKLQTELNEKYREEYNKIDYSDRVKSHEDKEMLAQAKLHIYDSKIIEIKNLIEFLQLKLMRF